MAKEKTPTPEPKTERQMREEKVVKANAEIVAAVLAAQEAYKLTAAEMQYVLSHLLAELIQVEMERQYDKALGKA